MIVINENSNFVQMIEKSKLKLIVVIIKLDK